MTVVSYTIRWNKDNTVTVRQGRHVEHFSADGKTEYELVEAIRWSLISKGGRFSWNEVHDTLTAERKANVG
jgi:hypothetical protein